MSADQRLTQFLKEGKDWERKATSIPGIFLLRLPGLRSTTAPTTTNISYFCSIYMSLRLLTHSTRCI